MFNDDFAVQAQLKRKRTIEQGNVIAQYDVRTAQKNVRSSTITCIYSFIPFLVRNGEW